MADEQVSTNAGEGTLTNAEPVNVITEENKNSFTSDQLEEALNNLKAGKVFKPAPKVEENPNALKIEKPEAPKVEEVKAPAEKPEAKEVVAEPAPDFDAKVAEAVAKAIENLKAAEKPVELPKPKEPEFQGYKTAEELQAAYEKDPVGTFNKVVAKQVAEEMAKFKAEAEGILAPLRNDLEGRQVANHRAEAEKAIKEMADPNFMKLMDKVWKANPEIVQAVIDKGKNPYIEIGKLARAENIANTEKSAYERGVKETEARLAKANRAVVEGGGKVQLEQTEINLNDPNISSEQVLKYLAAHGKA